jgi:hypothetical protein
LSCHSPDRFSGQQDLDAESVGCRSEVTSVEGGDGGGPRVHRSLEHNFVAGIA